MQIDSAWQNGMNSDDMAEWLLTNLYKEVWQSVVTAPKNEDSFIAWFASPTNIQYGYIGVSSWDTVRDCFRQEESDAKVTFWMPLPSKPTFITP